MRNTRFASGRSLFLLLLVAGISATPALSEDIRYRGWGPRVGVANNPDQLLGGAHFDFGEFSPNVRFLPNVELGVGDDHTVVSVTGPAHYVWRDLEDTRAMPDAPPS